MKPLIIDDSNWQQFVGDGPVDGGYGFVDRDYSQVEYGAMEYAGVVPLPLIPKAEWPDRIADMERTKSRLSDIVDAAGIPCLDQGSIGYCTTEDTEVLTDKGWVGWPDYNGSDLLGTMSQSTGRLEFQSPLARQVLEYDGPMIYSTNRRADFAVTPDHRMLVRKWSERLRTLTDSFEFQRAGDLGWYFGLPHATSGWLGTELRQVAVPDDRQYSGDDFLAMVSLVVSDGYAGGSESTKNWVSFCCFRPDRYEKMAAIAHRVGFHEKPGRKGVWARYDAGALAEWFRQNAYTRPPYRSPQKKLPDLVKCASERQIRHFLDVFGDKTHNPDISRQYFTTSKRLADDIQELLLRTGSRGTICNRDASTATTKAGVVINSKASFVVCEARAEKLSIDRKKQLEQENYKGLVYCATVPNGTLVTRRNNSVLISGNCHAFSPCHAAMTTRALMNQPFKLLSASSVGGPVTGFKNKGSWIGFDLKRAVEFGFSEEKFYPMTTTANHWTPEAEASAAENKITEYWELKPKNFDEVATCLLSRISVNVGLGWWGHAVEFLDLVLVSPGKFGVLFQNSWSSAYGSTGNGRAILSGSKMIPDEAYAFRSVGASD